MARDPHIAFSRFGLGSRPGDLAKTFDPAAALLAELDAADAGVLSGNLPDGASIFADTTAALMERRVNRKAGDGNAVDDPQALPGAVFQTEVSQRLYAVQAAHIGFVERLVAFWANHFAIAADAKQEVRALAGAFEREAIRPHVLGRFGTMVAAVTRHPAMLFYLNNAVSVGPDSQIGQKQKRGLNENHGRELMELHTLGVNGGYIQADVTSLAKVLTGWGVGQQQKQADSFGQFTFRERAHEPGPQTVMGKVYPQSDVTQGQAVLDFLSANPATARHVVGKFVAHFVADAPDPGLVGRMVQVFESTGGDLKALAVALVNDDAAWSAPASKLRTPQEFIWAAVRALNPQIKPQQVVKIADDLGQAIWNPPSPAGYADDAATWLAPGAMTDRLDVAQLIASRTQGLDDPRAVAVDLLGDALTPETATAIARAESPEQGLALLLMSPEFQRR